MSSVCSAFLVKRKRQTCKAAWKSYLLPVTIVGKIIFHRDCGSPWFIAITINHQPVENWVSHVNKHARFGFSEIAAGKLVMSREQTRPLTWSTMRAIRLAGSFRCECLLSAVGRVGSVEGLGLEKVGVKTGALGMRPGPGAGWVGGLGGWGGGSSPYNRNGLELFSVKGGMVCKGKGIEPMRAWCSQTECTVEMSMLLYKLDGAQNEVPQREFR